MRMRLGALAAVCWQFAVLTSVASAQQTEDPYAVQPGDMLLISVWGEEDLQGEVLIGPDGGFAFPLVGQVDARGMTAAQLQQVVRERLEQYISSPVVTVSVVQVNGNKVYVIGQVNDPGEYVMNPAIDVIQALSVAGGTTPFASLDDIIILRRDAAGQQTAVRFRYSDVIRGRNLDQNIRLQSGDVVVVP